MDGVKNNRHIPVGNVTGDRFWEASVKLFEKRLELVASNIANADTPNYKARDFDFKAALAQALTEPEKSLSASPQTVAINSAFSPKLLYRTPSQSSVDGNTVDVDAEQAVFINTAIRYEFAIGQAIDTYKSLSELFKNMK